MNFKQFKSSVSIIGTICVLGCALFGAAAGINYFNPESIVSSSPHTELVSEDQTSEPRVVPPAHPTAYYAFYACYYAGLVCFFIGAGLAAATVLSSEPAAAAGVIENTPPPNFQQFFGQQAPALANQNLLGFPPDFGSKLVAPTLIQTSPTLVQQVPTQLVASLLDNVVTSVPSLSETSTANSLPPTVVESLKSVSVPTTVQVSPFRTFLPPTVVELLKSVSVPTPVQVSPFKDLEVKLSDLFKYDNLETKTGRDLHKKFNTVFCGHGLTLTFSAHELLMYSMALAIHSEMCKRMEFPKGTLAVDIKDNAAFRAISSMIRLSRHRVMFDPKQVAFVRDPLTWGPLFSIDRYKNRKLWAKVQANYLIVLDLLDDYYTKLSEGKITPPNSSESTASTHPQENNNNNNNS
jgi:hypothetical protein